MEIYKEGEEKNVVQPDVLPKSQVTGQSFYVAFHQAEDQNTPREKR